MVALVIMPANGRRDLIRRLKVKVVSKMAIAASSPTVAEPEKNSVAKSTDSLTHSVLA